LTYENKEAEKKPAFTQNTAHLMNFFKIIQPYLISQIRKEKQKKTSSQEKLHTQEGNYLRLFFSYTNKRKSLAKENQHTTI